MLRYQYMFIVFGIVLFLGFTFLILNYIKFKLKIEKVYLVCGILFGAMYLFLIPPYAKPDEELHINAAYHVSNVLLGTQGPNESAYLLTEHDGSRLEMNMRACDTNIQFSQSVNEDSYEKYLEALSEENEEKELITTEKKITSPTIVYLVSGMGIALGRILDLNYAGLLLLGGMFNMLLFVTAVCYSMKILPFGKKCLFVLAMFPIMVQQTSSFSYDNIIITASILITAIAMDKLYKKRWSKSNMIIYGIAAFFLLIAKSGAYSLIIGLPFLVGMKKEKLTKRNIIYTIGLLTMCLLILFRNSIVNLIVDENILQSQSNNSGGVYLEWADSYAMGIKECLMNPIDVVKKVLNTIIVQGEFLVVSAIASHLGWLDIVVPSVISFLFLVLLALGCLMDESCKEVILLKTADRIVMWCISILTIGVCFVGLFLYWTPREATYIMGLQGRYFLPVVLPLILPLKNRKIVFGKNREAVLVTGGYLLQCITIAIVLLGI